MPQSNKELYVTTLYGQSVPMPQHVGPDGTMKETGSENPLPVSVTGGKTEIVTFHNGAAAIGNGGALTVGGYKTVNVKITGNAANTARTLVFEAAGFDGVYEPIQGYRPKDGAMATESNQVGESWQFDVTGFETFRVRLSAITGGTVTVKGKAVS